MASLTEPLVTVRRQWNNPATAEYRLSAIGGIHWDSVSGGVGAQAPRPFLHGYVMCDEAVSGAVSHSCRHGPPPHRIKVCIVKRDNSPAVLRALEEKMGRQSKPNIDGKTMIAAMAAGAQRQQAWRFARYDVGLTGRAADALAEHGIDGRDRLMSASLEEIRAIRGIGKVALQKVCAYRDAQGGGA